MSEQRTIGETSALHTVRALGCTSTIFAIGKKQSRLRTYTRNSSIE
ncbi:hypothetical protein [Bifidobacterium criceti]|nr:hypothetical protein [Bifidobacterium criceti]